MFVRGETESEKREVMLKLPLVSFVVVIDLYLRPSDFERFQIRKTRIVLCFRIQGNSENSITIKIISLP